MTRDRCLMTMLRRAALLLGGLMLLLATQARAQVSNTLEDYTKWFDWADTEIEKIVAVPDEERTFENTAGAFDDIQARLLVEVQFMMVLSRLSPHASDREIGNGVEAALQEWGIQTSKREDLYRAIKAYAAGNPPLEGERARALELMMRDYHRSGMGLEPEKREELKAIQIELSELSIQFNKNAQEDETTVLLSPEELPGMPDEFLSQLEQSAGLYVVAMDNSTTMEIWRRCTSEETRKKVWVAYKRKGGKRNVRVLEQMLALRAQEAALLGYPHSAAYQTEILMTKNADTVRDFYGKLLPMVREKSDRDFAELRELKRNGTGDAEADFYAWDYWYYADIAMREKYSVDTEEVRQYFPLDSVLAGLFQITTTLYGIELRDETEKAREEGLYFWHPDVRFWRTYDTATGEMIGELYTDFHPRPNKKGGAFNWGFMPRKLWMDGTLSKPRVVVQCNFTRPTAEKPSLLTHDEVTTLFHEFGHFLHTVLSQTTTVTCESGERDFVELPSQIFENWCWEPEVLKIYAKHYETGEVLPDELLQGMIRARQFASGMLAERQFYYGIVDQVYNMIAVDEEIDTTQIGLDLQDRIEQYDGVEGTYFQCGFTHLTNYKASYYGYQWALVYSCDAFEKYQELGMMNREAGSRFVTTILSRGGLVDSMEQITDFLGREPEMDAYLKHLGL